ncbi:MAG TPA: DHH family phosphoesterase [Aciduliprofundum sp.]|nr:DHH family phosphoesterase [Aciduliprofundum sp.]
MKFEFLHPRLDEGLEEAVGRLEASSRVRIISHSDGDGVFAAATAVSLAHELGVNYHVTLLKHPDREAIASLLEEGYDLYLIMDLGSASEAADRKDVVILDHHQSPGEVREATLVNPTLYGADGGSEVCASSLAFLMALLLDRADLAPNFVAGCMADKQVPFRGINEKIYRLVEGSFRTRTWLNLVDLEVPVALTHSTEPYVRELAKGGKVEQLLSRLGIGSEQRVSELHESKAKELASTLVPMLAIQGASVEGMESVTATEFVHDDVHVNTVSKMVHLVARQDMGGEALAAVLEGRVVERLRDEYLEAEKILISHIEASEVSDRGSFYLVETREGAPAGRVAEVYLHYILEARKPVVASSREGDRMKFSLRAAEGHNVNLGLSAREAASEAGGQGGGHPLAAGASVPLDRAEDFLRALARRMSSS